MCVHSGGFALERAQFAAQDGASSWRSPFAGFAPGLEFLAADQELIDFAAILGLLLSVLGFGPCGRQVRESDRLHAKLEFGAEADRTHALLECW